MGSLHPLFAGAKPDQVFEAAIIVADDQRQLERMADDVTRRAQQSNARWAARATPGSAISLAVFSGM